MTKNRKSRTLSFAEKRAAAQILEEMATVNDDGDLCLEIDTWVNLARNVAHKMGKDGNEVSDSTIRTLCNDCAIEVTVQRRSGVVSADTLKRMQADMDELRTRLIAVEHALNARIADEAETSPKEDWETRVIQRRKERREQQPHVGAPLADKYGDK